MKNLTVNLHCMQNNFSDKLATPWHFSTVKARLYKKSFAPIFRTETLSLGPDSTYLAATQVLTR